MAEALLKPSIELEDARYIVNEELVRKAEEKPKTLFMDC